MFTTLEEIKSLTGFDTLPVESIIRAQGIIESYVGRVEAEVYDAHDFMLLGRATAYQAVYMEHDLPRIYGQAKTQQLLQYGNMVSFFDDGVSPFISPLSVLACRHLTWKRIRSIKTGSIYQQAPKNSGWKYE